MAGAAMELEAGAGDDCCGDSFAEGSSSIMGMLALPLAAGWHMVQVE
jgi:hypothetical protein